MKNFETLSGWLLVLGGVILGLQGLVNYSLMVAMFGYGTTVERIVYIAVGVSAVMMGYKMLLAMGKKK